MLSSPRIYVQIWTPPACDLVLAIIVKVDDPDGASHFEADVTTDRIEVQNVRAKTLEELKTLLAAQYSGASSPRRSM